LRLILVPVAYRSYIGFLCKVSSSLSPSKVLYSDFQIFIEPDRIHNVPAVHAETLHHIIMAVTTNYLVETCIRSAEFRIIYFLNTGSVFLSCIKIVGAAEIIFCTCTTYCREFCITIHEEFDLAFSPPSVIIDSPCQITTHIMTSAFNTVNNSIIGCGIWISSAELSMEIRGIGRYIGKGGVDLVVKGHVISITSIFHSDLAFLPEGHWPVTVEGTARINTNGQ